MPEPAAMGVAVEGDAGAAGGNLNFDRFGQASRYVDLFNKGQSPFEFSASSTVPWISLSASRGSVAKDVRLQVTIDWSKAPQGKGNGQLEFSGANTNFTVGVSTFNPSEPTRDNLQGFPNGY